MINVHRSLRKETSHNTSRSSSHRQPRTLRHATHQSFRPVCSAAGWWSSQRRPAAVGGTFHCSGSTAPWCCPCGLWTRAAPAPWCGPSPRPPRSSDRASVGRPGITHISHISQEHTQRQVGSYWARWMLYMGHMTGNGNGMHHTIQSSDVLQNRIVK